MNTLERLVAARNTRISETNPHGHQSEQLRHSTEVLTRSLSEGKKADASLADAMARLRKS